MPKTAKVYLYAKCSTCQKAVKWLQENDVDFEEVAIRESPPSEGELKKMLHYTGKRSKLFNTSGMDYRAMGLSTQLPEMSDQEAFALLRSNGMLVKRPFLLTEDGGATGFREKEWATLLK